MKRTIGGNVIVRNGIDLGYCFVPSILSLLPVCDVVNVCDADSTDGTREVLDALAKDNPKIRVLNYPWPNPTGQIDCILDWMNFSRERLGTNYHLHLEADEVLGPESYDYILEAATKEASVLGFWRYNFWEDEKHVLLPGQVLSPQVIRFAPTSYWLGGDSPHPKATQTQPAADWGAMAYCHIYHYGFIRPTADYFKKFVAVMRAIAGSEHADPTFHRKLTAALAHNTNWMREYHLPVERFAGEHPGVVREWLKNRGFLLEQKGLAHSSTSETAKYRALTTKHCFGCGVDIASHGDPVVPWAMNLELPEAEYSTYNCGNKPVGPIQLSGHAEHLPFNDNSLDFVYSSHLLEDFADWIPVLKEWVRVLKPGGKLIILLPDRDRWLAACKSGQPSNPAHRHESNGPEEIAGTASAIGCDLIESRFTDVHEGDYTILFVCRKPKSQSA